MRPRVLMVGRTRYRLPLEPSLARKFAALTERLDLRVLAAAPHGAAAGDGTFALHRGTRVAALDGPLFYGALPARIARELRRRPATAILAQSPYEALAATGGRGRGSTALPRARLSPRSPTASRSSRFAGPMPCGRCRPSRRASFRMQESSPRARSRPTPS